MNKGALRFLLLFFFASTRLAFAQSQHPESAGFSSQRLERVAELMQRQIDEHAFSGAVTLIARDNQIVYLRAQGVMDIETKRAMRTDTVFRVMSMTKPVVAVSILMLVEEGKLRLTDPVSRFIPELKGPVVADPPEKLGSSAEVPPTVPAEREITIRDLLTHTSGLMSEGASKGREPRIGSGESLADVLPRLGGAPLDFQPGAHWAYSPQFGFDVLARVVEVASGVNFGAFTKKRIFDLLAMKDTFFFPGEDRSRIATLYHRRAEGGLEKAPEMSFANGVYFSGGGGLFSTAEDYLRFALMLLNGGHLGEARLLRRESVDLMTSALVPEGPRAGIGFGLGVSVVTDAAGPASPLSPGSFGWSGAFNTHFFVDPKERLVAIFMTQSAFLETRRQLRGEFEAAVMQALIERRGR